jgi:predicted nucleic acid-binding protein
VASKCFLDSNVVLYLLSKDAARADIAEGLLRDKPVVSVQVLNEVANVCAGKLRMDWDETGALLDLVRGYCKVTPITLDTHENACRLARRYRMPFYDACIAAAARAAGCRVLYTEDMHHGLFVDDSLTLRNPFRAAGSHATN